MTQTLTYIKLGPSEIRRLVFGLEIPKVSKKRAASIYKGYPVL
jgi:hypothetical protein